MHMLQVISTFCLAVMIIEGGSTVIIMAFLFMLSQQHFTSGLCKCNGNSPTYIAGRDPERRIGKVIVKSRMS